MARLDEIGEGIASLLGVSVTPEPLNVDMTEHSPAEVTIFVRSVIDACHRKAAPISLIRIGDVLGERLLASLGPTQNYQGVPILPDGKLGRRIEFYRFQPASK